MKNLKIGTRLGLGFSVILLLLIVMTLIFVATWFGQSLNNWRVFNEEQAVHDAARVSWGRYLLDPDFWEKTLQNWQSEFLAVGTLVVFTIYLRQTYMNRVRDDRDMFCDSVAM